MTEAYQQAKARYDALEAKVKAASAAPILNGPKGPMGLTPDAVKASPEWRNAKATYDAAAKELRAFSGWFVKAFRKEYRAERQARIEAMTRR